MSEETVTRTVKRTNGSMEPKSFKPEERNNAAGRGV